MSGYGDFSFCYDSLMADVDYTGLTDFILDLFLKYDKKPTLLLDLACGTGNFSFEFAKKGIDVIGVDPSENMLTVATEKREKGSENPLFLNQSAEELDLFGTVDGAVCLLDSLNHINDIKNLEKAFYNVSLFLESERLFIFDLNTLYKHSKVLANNTFVKEADKTFCVWQNECEDGKTVDIFIDLFTENTDGSYFRVSEDFSETAFSEAQIDDILLKTGFEKIAMLDGETKKEVINTTERVLYIVRKKK